jgi:hypothetical protein
VRAPDPDARDCSRRECNEPDALGVVVVVVVGLARTLRFEEGGEPAELLRGVLTARFRGGEIRWCEAIEIVVGRRRLRKRGDGPTEGADICGAARGHDGPSTRRWPRGEHAGAFEGESDFVGHVFSFGSRNPSKPHPSQILLSTLATIPQIGQLRLPRVGTTGCSFGARGARGGPAARKRGFPQFGQILLVRAHDVPHSPHARSTTPGRCSGALSIGRTVSPRARAISRGVSARRYATPVRDSLLRKRILSLCEPSTGPHDDKSTFPSPSTTIGPLGSLRQTMWSRLFPTINLTRNSGAGEGDAALKIASAACGPTCRASP